MFDLPVPVTQAGPAPDAPGVPSSPSRFRRWLADRGLRPRKSLGQHFLVDRAALRRIVQAAQLQPEDTVVEVGPGPGVLTRELLAVAGRVIAVEKDAALAAVLRDDLGSVHPRLAVLAADMLRVEPEDLVGRGAPYKVVANLPYYVAAPILRRFLEARARPILMVVLLQREVALNVVAQPGAMSLLALGVQLYAVPAIVGTVKAGAFYPPPKVDSAIVRLAVRERPAVDVPPQRLFRVAQAGFSARRKQLANSLAHGLGIQRAGAVGALEAAGVAPQRRAETLSIQEWAALCRALEGQADVA